MKESRTIKRKLEKRGNNDDKIKGFYWKRDMKINSIKDEFYDKSRFEETSDFIKDKQGNFLFSHSDQLNRFAEHYSELVSDVTQHSLNNEYRVSLFQTNPNNNPTWDINDSITMEEIQNTVLDMKNNKTPGPDGIPIEFFKPSLLNLIYPIIKMILQLMTTLIVLNVYFHYLIKSGMVISLKSGIRLL